MFCREQAARIGRIVSKIEALGAQVIGIGNGTELMARDFAEQFDIQFPLLTDPSRKSFAAAGMKRNFGLGPSSFLKAGRAIAAGHRQGAVKGDPWQQGGVILVSPSGDVLLAHADGSAGDHLPPERILSALHHYRERPAA